MLQNDPDFIPLLQSQYAAALALPAGPDTEELHRAARTASVALEHTVAVMHAGQALQKARALIADFMAHPDSSEVRSRLAPVEALTTDAIDHLLDAREPERTRLMNESTTLRDLVRRVIADH